MPTNRSSAEYRAWQEAWDQGPEPEPEEVERVEIEDVTVNEAGLEVWMPGLE